MTAIALAAFLGLAGIAYARAHSKPTHVHVLCPQDGPFVFGHDEKNRTTINGRSIPAGDEIQYNPASCAFPLETYHNGPLLFR